jgi:hypothetical protein
VYTHLNQPDGCVVGWFFGEVSVDFLPTNRAGRTTFVNDGHFHQETHTSIVDDDLAVDLGAPTNPQFESSLSLPSGTSALGRSSSMRFDGSCDNATGSVVAKNTSATGWASVLVNCSTDKVAQPLRAYNATSGCNNASLSRPKGINRV